MSNATESSAARQGLRHEERPATARRRHRWALSDRALSWLFIGPTISLLLLINIFPLFWTIYLSFTNYRANIPIRPIRWVGLRNYTRIFESNEIWHYLQITAHFVVWSVLLETILGFALALLLNRKFRGHGLLSTLLVLPMLLSPALVGLFWKYIFDPQVGVFNYIVNYLLNAGSFSMLSNPHLAPWAVVAVDVWMWTPFIMLLCLAGLQSVPDALYEAAEIDRASRWQKFWAVTFPHVLPLLSIAVLFRAMESFKVFGLVMQLTGGGPGGATELMSVAVKRAAFVTWKTGWGAALAIVMFVIVFGASAVFVRYLNRVSQR
ncbi:MAG TPA: sugar ABC transporter permease [Gammaproteobacteria bacterium]|nr:sugar ABC transporter permease [Gammaproteobacteria bacterium]